MRSAVADAQESDELGHGRSGRSKTVFSQRLVNAARSASSPASCRVREASDPATGSAILPPEAQAALQGSSRSL